MKPGRKIVIAATPALVLAAGASAATAAVLSSGPVDSSGVIHGCWSNAKFGGSHAFVLQDAGTSCPRGTTAISWNKSTPGIDGGLVRFDASTATCTVLRSSGPDVVTVSSVTRPDISTSFYGCELSGLPANADVQVTPVWAAGDTIGLTAQLFPDATGGTDVGFSFGGSLGRSDTEFSWIAVPSS